MDALERNNFLIRLQSLQSLCRNDDDSQENSNNFPSSLLLICGQDGRFNRGAMLIMKYLFRGAVGKELIEPEIVLDARDEALEETVLLIKRQSVSIFYSPEMKGRIAKLISAVPFLVEYMPTETESDEIDLFQDRKVTDFKRMILENVKDGDKVGIPVPIGYDDIMEIEGWPLIQSFALDSVCCATGFFTARYKVVDISERLDTVVRSVDGYHLDNALQLMSKTISPHMDQFLQILDTSSAEQRRHLQAADIIGPLEVLFEFAAMETSSQEAATTMSPILLLGAYTAAFGASNEEIHSQSNWKSQKVGNSLHCILEACEPSIGLRWCRTYFLQRGKAHTLLSEIDSLVEEDSSRVTQLTTTAVSVPVDITDNVRRLEALYVKLWFTLRYTVKFAFAIHSDVLEAGTFIQQKMDLVMAGEGDSQSEESETANYMKGLHLMYESCKGWDLGEVRLLQPLEQLQVHMDCGNALGDIVSIEDVDDMGGACWTYIRVSVHSIPLRYSGKKTECTVAVGDTFLFSPLATLANSQQLLGSSKTYIPTMSDSVCVTHALPYYRSFVGAGVEEKTATRIISCARSTHYLSHLGLGRPLELTGSGLLSLPVLLDNPVNPVTDCDVRIFSEGFLIERFGSSRLPVLISIASHVQSVWVVDSAECLAQAIQSFYPNTALTQKTREDEQAPPAGLLIVFKLKTDIDREEEQLRGEGKSLLLPYNPLSPLLSFSEGDGECKYVSLFVPAGSRVSTAMITATAAWRVALRMHGVSEHRGAAEVRLPDRVLLSYIAFMDRFADGVVNEITSSSLLAAAAVSSSPVWQYPTMAPLCMRAAFSLSEMQRLSHFPFLTYITSKLELKKRTVGQKRKLCAVVGQAGSGVTIVGTSLFEQLSVQFKGVTLELDLTDARLNTTEGVNAYITALIRKLEQDCEDKSGDLLVVAIVVLSPLTAPHVSKVIEFICTEIEGSLTGVISVVSAAIFGETMSTSAPNSAGLGQELWRSSCISMLYPGVCDLVIAVNCANTAEDSFARLRSYVGDVNPTLPVLKALPGQLRLDNDFVEQVLSIILPTDRSIRSGRLTDRLSMGYPSEFLLKQFPSKASLPYSGIYGGSSSLTYPRLSTVRISAHELQLQWDASSVVAVLQLLFPAAKTSFNNSNTLFGERWHAPPKSNRSAKEAGYFARTKQLAIAKVMAAKQYTAGRQSFGRKLQELERTEPKLAGLYKRIRSVHGWLSTDSQGNSFEAVSGSHEPLSVLRVEANGGNIILRANRDEPNGGDGLVVEGIFDEEEKAVLVTLFRLCAQFKLPRVVPLKPSEITYSERFLIQSCTAAAHADRDSSGSDSGSFCAYFSADFRQYLRQKSLPSGWWFDGQIYVEASGNRSLLRPDIDEVLEVFVQGENRKREFYNQMLMEIQGGV